MKQFELQCWRCKRIEEVDEDEFWKRGNVILDIRLAELEEACPICTKEIRNERRSPPSLPWRGAYE